jgi:hypothetical protein
MAIHLGRSLPNASRDRPERRRESSPGTVARACRSYLVLLPVGFSLPSPLLATRCALTAPFHPCRPCNPRWDRMGSAVSFLWHSPWGRPRRPLTGTVLSVEPGLSSLAPVFQPGKSGHPTVWQWDFRGRERLKSKTNAATRRTQRRRRGSGAASTRREAPLISPRRHRDTKKPSPRRRAGPPFRCSCDRIVGSGLRRNDKKNLRVSVVRNVKAHFAREDRRTGTGAIASSALPLRPLRRGFLFSIRTS